MSCFLNISENGTLVPSVGIFNRCTRIRGQSNCAVFAMDGLATDSVVFPTMWKVLILSIQITVFLKSHTLDHK